MNEERLLPDQNKNPSVFTKPSDPNLSANGGNGYDHADSQYGRYGYDHQADNQYVNEYDNAINIVEMKVIIGLISMVDVRVIRQIMKDIESVDASVSMKNTIFMVIATYIVNTSGEIIRTTLTHSSQNKTKSLEGVV